MAVIFSFWSEDLCLDFSQSRVPLRFCLNERGRTYGVAGKTHPMFGAGRFMFRHIRTCPHAPSARHDVFYQKLNRAVCYVFRGVTFLLVMWLFIEEIAETVEALKICVEVDCILFVLLSRLLRTFSVGDRILNEINGAAGSLLF